MRLELNGSRAGAKSSFVDKFKLDSGALPENNIHPLNSSTNCTANDCGEMLKHN